MQKLPSPLPVTFGLTSEMCELLVAFEGANSLTDLASITRRDVSVVSRQLQRIAPIAPVLEKQQGRWRLSPLGRKISHWTQEAAATQRRILQKQTVLRIASTREFAARKLAPGLADLIAGESQLSVSVISSEEGVERVLLDGRADLGFDCGSPLDPSVRFKTVCDEAFVIVAAPAFLKRHRVRAPNAFIALPHLQYQRASASRLLQLSYDVPNIFASFNDIAGIRAAAVAGLGWAVLPAYAVRDEIRDRRLRALPGWTIRNERFGVWWMRDRADLTSWVARASAWLVKQVLA